jgi:hypothetical protein
MSEWAEQGGELAKCSARRLRVWKPLLELVCELVVEECMCVVMAFIESLSSVGQLVNATIKNLQFLCNLKMALCKTLLREQIYTPPVLGLILFCQSV